ncbi:MAG: lysophospholipid acyltransferase family protein [Burkholderiales bacterium]|nr:lysophospholipid acyltransferase family protein [Burkholderiales bacterium]MDE1928052.1 lysophospholipid acyltransferase family protein [Burkholderiales bacterium]MDE2158772.1 lysophospholipid acyltransferase family protein [Burkholderiales bacterium]MDE2503607.1 lysophospholipid acyltransferase family protein [Burkholderiales bacterium]
MADELNPPIAGHPGAPPAAPAWTWLLRPLGALPFGAVTALGWLLGRLLARLPTQRRRIGRINLELCFPELGRDEREALLRDHFVALAQMLLEYGYCWYAPRERVAALVRIEGIEHLRALDGRAAILAMPHFTGLDLAGLRISMERAIVSFYARQKDPALDAHFRQQRLRLGTGQVWPRQAGVRPVLKAMRQGLALYHLPDQDHGLRDAVFVDFFGVPAATLTAPARIAAVTGARLLPCYPRRERDGYTLVIEPPLDGFPGADPVADTQRLNQVIERQVRTQPQQYFWLHKRFKTRPPGQHGFY